MTACAAIRWIGEQSSDISTATFAGTKVTMTLSAVDDEVGDTLAVLRSIYLAFRVEGPQYYLSEDAVACLKPGVTGDSPINETLQTAWESLKALGNKHIGPNVGSSMVSQEGVLLQIYTSGALEPRPAAQDYFHLPGGPRRLRLRS